jgi:hypothetical protein
VIGLPPSLAGVEKFTDAVRPVSATTTNGGAPGTVAGTKLFETADGSPGPFVFAAVTVHVYVLPFVRPETAIGLALPPPEPVAPPSDDTHDAV